MFDLTLCHDIAWATDYSILLARNEMHALTSSLPGGPRDLPTERGFLLNTIVRFLALETWPTLSMQPLRHTMGSDLHGMSGHSADSKQLD